MGPMFIPALELYLVVGLLHCWCGFVAMGQMDLTLNEGLWLWFLAIGSVAGWPLLHIVAIANGWDQDLDDEP